METDPRRLLEIASAAARVRGTEILEIGFEKWTRSGYRGRREGKKIAVLYISDYLDGAPEEVLSDFIGAVADYVMGRKPSLGDAYRKYMASDGFILGKRPIYLKRSRNITCTDTGRYRNIYDSVQRLLDRGLLTADDLDNAYFTWTSKPNYTRLGHCQQIFRVVVISSVFDDPAVPESVFDFVVYHECLHLRQGYRPFNRHPHDAEFRRQEKLFPRYAETEAWLKKIPAMGRKCGRRLCFK